MRSHRPVMFLVAFGLFQAGPSNAQPRPATAPAAGATSDTTGKPVRATDPFAGLKARFIGPAVTSGRIGALAVHPTNPAIIYAGSASGGLWKTINGGASWQPVFDTQGSYSIGWVTIDPKSPNVVWVGTGENNSQRSVAYGDGVYRSDDGGRSWKNTGLKDSQHIGRIVIDPTNSDIVYAAAQGPLWNAGGDRGLYRTSDGGKSWEQVLKASEHTGVTDVVIDPRNHNVLIAATYQRRRHFFTLIDGGPESAIHRSTDGGKTWTKVSAGLPSEELGRIGLAISPVDPDVVYAIVEAANRKGGIYRSPDNGVTWEKRSDYNQGSMYYGAIFADPRDVNRVYVPDVFFQVSDDGGRTTHQLGQRYMHVDNHVVWVDPHNTDHLLVGNDGGLYRSFDRGRTWTFFENLPLAQYYDVDVDYAAPFYNVVGGLQDNNSLIGPSRTRSEHGILNQDWVVTQGGDGFVSRVDPEDPNTIYAELQHGVMVRVDKRSGERTGIQPRDEPGESPLRWNWDSPIVISPHAHTRLYTAAQKVYRSDDRGNSWKAISGDLTRQIDRNTLPVMGKVWGADAVAKNSSTALYSNISAIAESPKREGLLYVGTDDGLIQVTEDGGATWRKTDKLPGIPANAYVARIKPSNFDASVVYVAVENHQNGDFAPYLLRSGDAGRTWTSVTGDLPARGSTYAFAEDFVDPSLLFAGTEFAAYYSRDGGRHWGKIAGLPTIAVRDLAIQRRETDLVIGTFGRGVYVLDDYSPLRSTVSDAATLFTARDALLYVPTQQYGGPAKAFQGEMFFAAENPPFGAVFTYQMKDSLKTLRQTRIDVEKDATKAGRAIRYPTAAELRAEDLEEAPTILLAIADSAGQPIRMLTGPVTKGLQRVAWDLRLPAHVLPRPIPPEDVDNPFADRAVGPFVLPGSYRVTLSQRVGGIVTAFAGPVSFRVQIDPQGTLTLADHSARGIFQERQARLRRAVSGALELGTSTQAKMEAIKRALDQAPAAPRAAHERARDLVRTLVAIQTAMSGDQAARGRGDAVPPSISDRVNGIDQEQGRMLGRPTATHERQQQLAGELFTTQVGVLRQLVQVDIPALERELEKAGAPYTPGRVPEVPR